MIKVKFKPFCCLILPFLVLFFSLTSNGNQSILSGVSQLQPLSALEVEMLVKNIPAMKVRTYRYSPEEIMLNVRDTLIQANYTQHQEIFEALMKFIYISQVINFQNKITKNLLSETKELIKKFKDEGALNDPALVELLKLISVYDTNNPETLIKIIEAKEYPFPIYKFFAKYLYVSIIKNVDYRRKVKYEKEVRTEAFETWVSRSPENIVGNKNSLTAISQALEKKEDIFFDFMHYFNLLYLNRGKSNDIVNFTDDKIEKYINLVSKKFPDNHYFLNNFRIWFLSVMTPGYSYNVVANYFHNIMKTGTNQQKAIAFEHYGKQVKCFPYQFIPADYLKQIELLIEYLKVEEDYYGLRGIALGYINMAKDNRVNNQKALKLLKYVNDNTHDIQLKKLVTKEADKIRQSIIQ